MAIIARRIATAAAAAAVAAAAAPMPENALATPDPPSSPGFVLLEGRPSQTARGKRRPARSPSFERQERAAAQAVKRRLK